MTFEEKALNEIQKQQDETGIAFLGVIQLEVPEFNAVKNALEKQIPKKTKVVRSNFVDLDRFCCPSCGKGFIEKLDGEWVAGRLDNYCADCGQKIDWSAET